MPHFVLTATDKPNALELRMATRQAHLDYVRGSDLVKLGGPLLDAAGEIGVDAAIAGLLARPLKSED